MNFCKQLPENSKDLSAKSVYIHVKVFKRAEKENRGSKANEYTGN